MIFLHALLIGIIGGFIGCMFDTTIRFVFEKSFIIDRKLWFKLFLNYPVYLTGFFLIFWLSKIPCLNLINLLPLTIITGGIVLSAVELAWGLLLNIKLKLGIWDYSNLVFFNIKIPNFKGQISILHGIIWGLLTPVVFNIINFLEKLL